MSHFFRINEPGSRQASIVRAIDEVSLDVPERHFVSLVGPSGCGKTTLLNIISGLEPLQVGTVDVAGHAPAPGRRAVAYMQARDALLPWRSVSSNAGFGLEIRGIAGPERLRIVDQLLGRVGLAQFRHARPRQLSQGMRQRVALARTFALDSPILLMDEPFGALDAQTKQQLQALLLELWETDRRTVILVTHDLQEAIAMSDRVVVMSSRPGRVKTVVNIDIARPRTIGDLIGQPAFTALYREIRAQVEETAG